MIRILHQHSGVGLVLLGDQANVVLNVEDSTLGLVLDGLEVEEQIILDSAGSVGLEIRVVAGVQLSGDTDVVVVCDHHVDVSRAVGVTSHDLEQLGRRTRSIDGVLSGLEAVEPELALLVGAELATEVVASLVLRVVGVVLAVGAGLPHIKDGVGNALTSVDITDDTMEEGELTILGHVLDYTGTEVTEGSLRGPERAKDSGRCGSLAIRSLDLVVDLIDEAETVSGCGHIAGTVFTHDSMPRISHTRHVSLRFFL